MITEFFIRSRKLNICYVFHILVYQKKLEKIVHTISLKYSKTPKYKIYKIPKKRELQEIGFNNSSVIDYEDFIRDL